MTAEPNGTARTPAPPAGAGSTRGVYSGSAAATSAASRGVRRDERAARSSGDPAADVAAARAELAATLDAIQDKLNVPKRIRAAAHENPLGLAAVGVGAAAALAGAVWLLVRVLRH
jgi:hypothetical protein